MNLAVDLKGSMGPGIGTRKNRSGSGGCEITGRIMVMIDGGSFSQKLKIWCCLSRIPVEGDIVA